MFWNQCLEGWGGRVNRWIYDPEIELSRKAGWNSQEGWNCISWTSKCKGFWSSSGEGAPHPPTPPAVWSGPGPPLAPSCCREEQWAAQPPRETPSVLRRSQCLQKRSFVHGQPLCVFTGLRLCPAGDGTQDRWPLRSSPLRTLTLFQKCSRSVT